MKLYYSLGDDNKWTKFTDIKDELYYKWLFGKIAFEFIAYEEYHLN